jgi:hypothetical protein
MESNRPNRCKFRNKKENILEGLVTLKEKMMEKYQWTHYNGTLREVGRE